MHPPANTEAHGDWREICARAIGDGRAAAAELSATALRALAELPPDRRAEVLDHRQDSRVRDLRPDDAARIRESIPPSKRKFGASDLAVDEARLRQRRRHDLDTAIIGYELSLYRLRADLHAAAKQLYADPEEPHLIFCIMGLFNKYRSSIVCDFYGNGCRRVGMSLAGFLAFHSYGLIFSGRRENFRRVLRKIGSISDMRRETVAERNKL